MNKEMYLFIREAVIDQYNNLRNTENSFSPTPFIGRFRLKRILTLHSIWQQLEEERIKNGTDPHPSTVHIGNLIIELWERESKRYAAREVSEV